MQRRRRGPCQSAKFSNAAQGPLRSRIGCFGNWLTRLFPPVALPIPADLKLPGIIVNCEIALIWRAFSKQACANLAEARFHS